MAVYKSKRGSGWTEEETLCLLSLWQENSVEEQLEDPKVNNAGIYRRITQEMEEKGYEKSSDQCKIKMHTLKRSYRMCKTKLKTSGQGRVTCKYFSALDAILGSRPASSPIKVIEPLCKKRRVNDEESNTESENESQGSINSSCESDDTMTSTPMEPSAGTDRPKKRVKTTEPSQKIEHVKASTSKNNAEETKVNKSHEKKAPKDKRNRKSRLEVALGSIMEGFSNVNEKAEDKFIDLEQQKIKADMKRLDFDKTKLEFDERQKREERQHQFNMMQMIMGMVGQRTTQQAGVTDQNQMPTIPQEQPQIGTNLDNSSDHSYYNF